MPRGSLDEAGPSREQPNLNDTVPNTAEPVSSYNSSSQHFAHLVPVNAKARLAFDYAVDAVKGDPELFAHARRCMCIESARQESVSVASVFTDSDAIETEVPSEEPPHRFGGYFRFDLSNPPRDPRVGWVLGDGRGPAAKHVDFLLSGPKKVADISGIHAMISFHERSCRLVFIARHKSVLHAPDGSRTTVTLARSAGSPPQELAFKDEIRIGDCAYSFSYEDCAKGEEHRQQLEMFMKKCHGVGWGGLSKLLESSPDATPMRLHKYSWSLGAFAEGTFGQVAGGTASDGNAVAVKRIKSPREEELSAHRKMMGYLGSHPNILELLDCFAQPDATIPEAYCIYQPLACGNLLEFADQKRLTFATQVTLFRQYLNGLSFLHDEKGVMHRDIKPNNLGVVTLNPPVGVILDLDSATRQETSTDHGQGTLGYLAPEIVALKVWERGKMHKDILPTPYGRKVEIWALGLTAYRIYTGKAVPNKCVTEVFYQAIRSDLARESETDDNVKASFVKIMREMLRWNVSERLSAAQALKEIKEIDQGSSEESGIPIAGPSSKLPQQGDSSASGSRDPVRRKK
ncbi:hypothetical protein MMC30_000690 [Trapelia coarctata]|nr:hypothetical protein [Trapelia coarctata]